MLRLIALVANENARLVDVAVASDWGPPRRQKKLAATAGLDNTAGCGALGELAALLAPRAARRRASRERVDDPVALRRLFATADAYASSPT